MVWPFTRSAPDTPSRRTIETIYGAIVAQARNPAFYRDLGVADTVSGRFDVLLLHLWIALRTLRGGAAGAARLSQALFDHFCSDLDANLREMGVGDLTVPKRMQSFGEAFYGRAAAYDAAASDHERLAAALDRNVLNGADLDNGRRLATYAMEALAALRPDDVAAGVLRFSQSHSVIATEPSEPS